ncbi:MAG: sensor histidine kinase [Chitinophagaceae bacterium]|nr:sensor histidine kinase [Chitinophagaceae bacterium]
MKVLVFVFLLFSAISVQSQINLDSLQQVLIKTKVDRTSLLHYSAQMQAMAPNETDASHIIGEWVIKNADADSLRQIQATAHFILGKIYTAVLDFEQATHFLTTALSIAEKNNFYMIEAESLNTLGTIYERNEQNEKAVEYYRKSLAISQTNSYIRGAAIAEFNVGNTLLKTQRENSNTRRYAINLMLQSYNTVNKLKDTQSIIAQSSALGYAYTVLKNYDSATIILENAEKLIRSAGKEAGYIRHYTRVAKLYNDKKKYKQAIKSYESGLAVAKRFQIPRWLCMCYSGLAETYENMGDYKKANQFNQLNIRMHDALVSKENFIAAADIQNRYERSKKDNEILKLAADNRQRSTLNKFLIGASFGLLLISFLGYLNFQNRNKIAKQQEEIQRQKIRQLEKDKQLVSIDAMLKGQEEERSRIAKDLHDGLGGLLSGTKLSFMNVRETTRLSSESAKQFDRSLSMLDNTIGDLRKVAQNLMPEALVKFGLHEALRDFCDTVETSSGTKLFYQQYGARKLGNTAEVFIYRIIQELINNVIKHSDASQIIVQLTMDLNKTRITVEDNGKGFDKNILTQTKGAGMANINYRVQYFNGTIDIVSAESNGTSVNIELKV